MSSSRQSMSTPYWTPEKIESSNQKYGIHDRGFNFHYPRESFLEKGYCPPSGYVKDFCVVEHDRRWHVFHIDGRPGEVCWITGNEISFGHCSTDDFQHWIRHQMPLAIGDGRLDNQHVWAPFIISRDDRFIMFYMGQGTGGTAISCAESTDLEQWRKTGPIKIAEGRDPFVFRHDGDYILVFTSHRAIDGFEVLGACRSRDLEHWEPIQEVIKSRHGSPESPSIHPLGDGRHVLWFNDWGGSYPQRKRVFRACYTISDDPLCFQGDDLTTFAFIKGEDEVPSDEVWDEHHCTFNHPPTSIELVAKGRAGIWFISYFRVVGNSFRLFFGELDWNTTPATIREIRSIDHLEQVIGLVK